MEDIEPKLVILCNQERLIGGTGLQLSAKTFERQFVLPAKRGDNCGTELMEVANQQLSQPESHSKRESPCQTIPGEPGISGWLAQRTGIEPNTDIHGS